MGSSFIIQVNERRAFADGELIKLKFPNSFLIRLHDIGCMSVNDYWDKHFRFVENWYISRVF
jgi:hypothetical protein